MGKAVRRALGVTWFALRVVYREMVPLTGVGLMWFVLCVTLPSGAYWLADRLWPGSWLRLVAVPLGLVVLPPATAGLYLVAERVAQERSFEHRLFWRGFRDHVAHSYGLVSVIVLSGSVLIFDAAFYLQREDSVSLIVGFAGIGFLVFWLAVQLYLFPLLIEEEDKALKGILKNAGLLTLAFPFFSLGILLVSLMATVLGAFLLFLMPTLWMPFLAVLNSRALLSSLDEVRRYREAQHASGVKEH